MQPIGGFRCLYFVKCKMALYNARILVFIRMSIHTYVTQFVKTRHNSEIRFIIQLCSRHQTLSYLAVLSDSQLQALKARDAIHEIQG